MSARIIAAIAVALTFGHPDEVHAQDGAKSDLDVKLTQEKQPSAKPWEDPALFSFEIDPHGKDRINIGIAAEAKKTLAGPNPSSPRTREQSAGLFLRWLKDTKEKKEKDNLEAGLTYEIGFDPASMLSVRPYLLRNLTHEQLAELADRRAGLIDFTHKFSVGYARTAEFPDLEKDPCKSNPDQPQCETQHKESIRVSYTGSAFNPHFEDNMGKGLAYSFAPKFGADYDHLLNSPIDSKTGETKNGGYASVVAGAALILTPEFSNPGWELKGSLQVRQKLSADKTRAPSIESTAELTKASLIYYFIRPEVPGKNGWRAGFGIEYSSGSDPLDGKKDEEKILLSLRVGRY